MAGANNHLENRGFAGLGRRSGEIGRTGLGCDGDMPNFLHVLSNALNNRWYTGTKYLGTLLATIAYDA